MVSDLHPLPYGRQSIDDDDIDAVVRCLRSDYLTQGPEVRRFEEALCETTGARYAVAVANGTAALHLAALAAGVRADDVGITSTITFVASANAIRYAGGTARFCDVDPDTGLLSMRSLEECVARTPPKVIVPVDLTGAVADLPRVNAIAKRAGALVVEDAAHSLGATYDVDGVTYRAGSCQHADMAILSFHPVKHVTTGEGGAITTNDEALYRELLDLRTHGITKDPQKLEKNDGPWYYEQRALGFNYRITDLQCALGSSQLKKLGRFVSRRREIAARYDEAFAQLSSRLRPLVVPAGVRSAYHLYVVRLVARPGEDLAGVAERRKALYLALAEQRIHAQVHYIPVHTQPDFRRHGMGSEKLPGADAYYASCLSLPMFPTMSDGDVDRVVAAVTRIVSEGA
ncbi:UDP-4-amino-4,6-dideoxy-N-acetyl-beta-L-altrosamine transaminase [Labilithrix luteola]|nr:UDP-4-amino-4,6-dideoxy-N-acetyl-beta-L-altrosamine transaminase [Labilithrix luteola]